MANKFFSLTVIFAILAAATACAPATTSEEVVSMQNDGTTVASVPVPNGSSGQEGNSAASAADGDNPTDLDPSLEQQSAALSLVYSNNTYKFSVGYPSDFTLLEQTADKLDGLVPLPLAAFRFTNPQAASSDIAELEPADLEIRVYDALNAVSLEHWLDTTNLGGEGVTNKSFETTHVSGLRVCLATMVFPGCSYLVMGNQRVYQLIPVNQTGEDMVKTFQILP